MTTQQTHTTNSTAPPPLMLPPRKAAAVMGLPEYTIRRWLLTGFIKGVPCGRKQLINIDLLRQKLEEV